MAQIAEAAGLQQSSIYYWFGSKAEVLASILEQVNRIPLAIVERERARRAGPWPMRLHRLVREDVLALCGFPFDINEIHRLAAAPPRRLRRLLGRARPPRRRGRGAARRGRAQRASCAPVDTRLAARTLLAADEATQNWFRSDPGRLRQHAGTWPTTGRGRRSRVRCYADAVRAAPARCAASAARRATVRAWTGSPQTGRGQSSPLARQRSRSAAKAACCSVRKAAMSSASASRNGLVVGEAERRRLDLELELAGLRPRPAGRAARRPRPGGSGSGRRSGGATGRRARRPASDVEVPHRHRAPDELVAAGPLHPVHAQVGAADADRVLRRPRAGRVVLRGHQPVAGVERRRHRRPEVHVAEAEHEVRRRRTRSGARRRSTSSPLMRRMNSRFDGHHGASSRTTSM